MPRTKMLHDHIETFKACLVDWSLWCSAMCLPWTLSCYNMHFQDSHLLTACVLCYSDMCCLFYGLSWELEPFPPFDWDITDPIEI